DGRVRIAPADAALQEAEIIEYAVEMVRLPADRMLDRVLAQGPLDSATLEGIVRRLAAFHAAAATGTGVNEHASPEALRQKFTGTLGRIGPGGLEGRPLDHLRQWLLGELERRRE